MENTIEIDTFDDMLTDIYENMNQTNEKYNITIPEPIILKNRGTLIWKNVKEFLKISKRPPDHFLSFLRKESIYTINWLSDSKSAGLIFNQKKIKNDFLIEKMKTYLQDYVVCKSCKSINTYIEKDKQIRKYNFICTNCNNQYYI